MTVALAFVSNSLFKFISNVKRTRVSSLCGKFTKSNDTKNTNGIL